MSDDNARRVTTKRSGVDLKAVYEKLRQTLPWPKQLPSGKDVRLVWCACGAKKTPSGKTTIAVSSRLNSPTRVAFLERDLAAMMAASIWPDGGDEYREFLKQIGVHEVEVDLSGVVTEGRELPYTTIRLLDLGMDLPA
jgi:hypothetical protein